MVRRCRAWFLRDRCKFSSVDNVHADENSEKEDDRESDASILKSGLLQMLRTAALDGPRV